MNTNRRLYALVVTSNRFGRDVVCELSEPPEDWRAFDYMQMRIMSQETGELYVNELIHYEMAANEWFGYTGLPLVWCIR
jgi:hypothetical protein